MIQAVAFLACFKTYEEAEEFAKKVDKPLVIIHLYLEDEKSAFTLADREAINMLNAALADAEGQ